MGNSGSFSSSHLPPKAVPKPFVCPFQLGVNVNPHCDGVKCEFGLWSEVDGCCVLRLPLKRS